MTKEIRQARQDFADDCIFLVRRILLWVLYYGWRADLDGSP